MTESNPSPNYFVTIPSHILDDPRIDDSTAILFGRLVSLTSHKGFCWASNKYLADLTKCKERELKYRIKTLEDCGYIKIDTKKNGVLWDRKIFLNLNYEGHIHAPRRAYSCPSKGTGVPHNKISKDIDKKKDISKEISKKNPPSPKGEHGVTPTASPPDPDGSLVALDSKSKNKEKEFPPELKSLAKEMVDAVKAIKPDAKIGHLNAILQALDGLTRLDGRTPQKVRDVFMWAISSSFWQKHFMRSNPAKYLREKLDTLEVQMLERPQRKNKPTGQSGKGEYDELF